jgi:hypothetical protein
MSREHIVARLDAEIARLQAAVSILSGKELGGRVLRRIAPRRRVMSMAARKKIAAAQRARWARLRAAQTKKQ